MKVQKKWVMAFLVVFAGVELPADDWFRLTYYHGTLPLAFPLRNLGVPPSALELEAEYGFNDHLSVFAATILNLAFDPAAGPSGVWMNLGLRLYTGGNRGDHGLQAYLGLYPISKFAIVKVPGYDQKSLSYGVEGGFNVRISNWGAGIYTYATGFYIFREGPFGGPFGWLCVGIKFFWFHW